MDGRVAADATTSRVGGRIFVWQPFACGVVRD